MTLEAAPLPIAGLLIIGFVLIYKGMENIYLGDAGWRGIISTLIGMCLMGAGLGEVLSQIALRSLRQ